MHVAIGSLRCSKASHWSP